MVADKPERVGDYFAVIGLDPDVIPLQVMCPYPVRVDGSSSCIRAHAMKHDAG